MITVGKVEGPQMGFDSERVIDTVNGAWFPRCRGVRPTTVPLNICSPKSRKLRVFAPIKSQQSLAQSQTKANFFIWNHWPMR